MTSNSFYRAELRKGDEIAVTVHPTAAEVRLEIERARSAGWRVHRINRDDVAIDEAELRAIAGEKRAPAERNR